MATKAFIFICCLALTEAITLWSDYTPPYSSDPRLIKGPISTYEANNEPKFFGGHLYHTDMNYKIRPSFKTVPFLFPSFGSPSFKGIQVYGKNLKPSKAMNAPSPCSHYLINEGLSAYKTEAMDGEHIIASYDYTTNSDVPLVQGSFSGPGASYSW